MQDFPQVLLHLTTKLSLLESEINLLRAFEAKHWIFTRKLTNSHTTVFLFCRN